MEDDRQDYFEELTTCSREGFEVKFKRTANELGVSAGLKPEEQALLCEAAFLAALCNISFNGLGACGGAILPDKELIRCRLEQAYMKARARFLRCRGWRNLAPGQKKSVQSAFFTVLVQDHNLTQ